MGVLKVAMSINTREMRERWDGESLSLTKWQNCKVGDAAQILREKKRSCPVVTMQLCPQQLLGVLAALHDATFFVVQSKTELQHLLLVAVLLVLLRLL